jgi:hypothetical protein
MDRMNAVKNVYDAITGRNHAEDWGKWAKANPRGLAIIERVQQLRKTNG